MSIYYEQNKFSENGHVEGRKEMENWLSDLQLSPLTFSPDFLHSVRFYMNLGTDEFISSLHECAQQIPRL